MKNWKEFNNINENHGFNMKDLLNVIKEKYTEELVAEKFDDEIMNWLDDDWDEEYETEFDWYGNYGNNEAEDVIIDEMIDYVKNKMNISLTVEESIELKDLIQEEYYIL